MAVCVLFIFMISCRRRKIPCRLFFKNRKMACASTDTDEQTVEEETREAEPVAVEQVCII